MHEIEIYRPVRTLHGSPWFVALTALFAAFGVRLLFIPGGFQDRLVAAVFTVWFGWSAVQRAHRFFLERTFVRVEPEGITIGGLLRTRSYAWSDIERITFLNFPASYRTGSEAQARTALSLKPGHPEETNRYRRGVDVLLPPDLEDVNGMRFARYLEERRLAALGETLAV